MPRSKIRSTEEVKEMEDLLKSVPVEQEVPKKKRGRKPKKKHVEIVPEEPEQSELLPTPPKEPKPKRTRAPTKYNLFVKEQMATEKIKSLPPKEKFAVISTMWRNNKEKA